LLVVESDEVFSDVVQESDMFESLLELEMQNCDCDRMPMFLTKNRIKDNNKIKNIATN